MTDRPIIFSAPMVRALLDGRKTQARRVLKPWPGMQANWLTMETLHRAPTCYLREVHGHLGVQMQHPLAGTAQPYGPVDPQSPLTWVRLPYAPGDRLWVREGWNVTHKRHLAPGEVIERTADDCAKANGGFAVPACDGVVYRATGSQEHPTFGKALWRSPIHMPRWASRLTLTVTDVRVQRLQDISNEDAVAEGIQPNGMGWWSGDIGQAGDTPRAAFALLWNSIHGPGAWAQKPWVAALTFDVHRCNIDDMGANHASAS